MADRSLRTALGEGRKGRRRGKGRKEATVLLSSNYSKGATETLCSSISKYSQ